MKNRNNYGKVAKYGLQKSSAARSRRFFNGWSKLEKKIYHFHVKISSIKLFSLLLTSNGEATGIN